MLVGGASALLLAGFGVSAGAASPPEAAAGRYIVVLRDGDAPEPAAHARAHGLTPTMTYGAALRGYAVTLSAARLQGLREDPAVAFVSEDREVSIAAQSLPTGVNRIEGDASSTVAGNGGGSVDVGVAVIDTGVGPHGDLNITGGKNCNGGGTSYADGNGHGTHVAGTIGARDNTAGVVGVAPGARIYAVRVLNSQGSGTWAQVICGVDWVTANAASLGIKVANMSLGGGGSDDGNCGKTNADALHKAICGSVAAGVTYVVAAGNSGVDFASSAPASYDEVLTVTAVADFNGGPGGGAASTCRSDVDETAADFSNFATLGADKAHTIAAPGVCILSTWRTRTSATYSTISGTSMASPHVAGAGALCLIGPCAGMTPSQVATKLQGDAAAQPAAYGFAGDPGAPVAGRHYGHLVYVGGY